MSGTSKMARTSTEEADYAAHGFAGDSIKRGSPSMGVRSVLALASGGSSSQSAAWGKRSGTGSWYISASSAALRDHIRRLGPFGG